MWLNFAIVCLILGVASLITTIVFALKWDAVDIIYTLTGVKAKRAIQRYKNNGSRGWRTSEIHVNGGSKSGHVTTESLLAKSTGHTKDLSRNQPLTLSKNIKSTKSITNSLKNKVTGRSISLNGKIAKTSISNTNPVVGTTERTEVLVGDLETPSELNKISGNSNSDRPFIQQKGNHSEKGVEVSPTRQVEDKTSILSEDDKTSILSESEGVGTTILEEDGVEQGDALKLLEEWSSKTQSLSNESNNTQTDRGSQVENNKGQQDVLKATIEDPDDDLIGEERPVSTPTVIIDEPESTGMTGVLGEDSDTGGQTEIIGEDGDYKRILKEEFESPEFHEFKVLEVVTSYDSMI